MKITHTRFLIDHDILLNHPEKIRCGSIRHFEIQDFFSKITGVIDCYTAKNIDEITTICEQLDYQVKVYCIITN